MTSVIKSFLVLIFLFVFSFADAEAQICTAEADWTFNPPPINGQLEMGETIQVCVDIVLYSHIGGEWIAGLELGFPQGWYLSTLNVVSIPESCSGGGEWVYLDSVTCGFQHLGPGFYYDGGSDGNVCNNFGDDCSSTPENMTFCFELMLANECPTDEEDLFPHIRIISDSYFADWSSTLCPDPIYVQPDLPNLSLNCCGQGAISPGSVALCESQCLFDLLQNAPIGGYWTGPEGYVNTQYCGNFDINSDIPGEYTYHFEQAMCFLTSTITVIDADLGIVGEIYSCSGEYGYLNEAIADEYPNDGIWYNLAGEVVVNGIAEFEIDGLGIYEYQYYSEMGCLMTLGVEASIAPTSGMPVSTVICESSGTFCPFEVFESLQPSGVEVSTGGNWIVYDNAGNYLDFLPFATECYDYDFIEDYDSNPVVFSYITGAQPCSPHLTSFTVFVDPASQSETVGGTACDGSVDLGIYLPGGIPQGGQWTDGLMEISSILSVDAYPPDTTLNLYYTYNENAICSFSILVPITLMESDQNSVQSNYTYCGDGSILYLATLLTDSVSGGGVFNPSPEVILLPQNAEIYTYSTSLAGCEGTLYSFHITIDDSLHYTDLTTTLTEDGNGYTVSFTITGGEPPYVVTGGMWPGGGGVFTSLPIPLGTPYIFTISDSGPCGNIDVMGEYMPPCTVDAGESPGEMDLCQPAPFCLFDEMANADTGGVWTGPPGWTDAGCGLVDPATDPPGDYFYIVADGAVCADTAMVTLVPVEMGIVLNVVSCGGDEVDLALIVGIEGDGYWMAPGYPQSLDTILNGLVDSEVYSSGIYTYIFYDSNGCFTIQHIDLHIAPGYLGDNSFDPLTVCAETLNFSPAAAIGIIDSADSPTDGNWIIFDSSETVMLAYWPEWDVSFSGDYLMSLGSSLILKYIFGQPPCTPTFITLPITVSGGITAVTATVCQSDQYVNLPVFLPIQPIVGGSWSDQSGTAIVEMLDLSAYESGSVHVFFYNGFSEAGCSEIVEVWLTISESADAGDDYYMTLCGSGEMIDMHNLLPTDVNPSGSFPTSLLLADPSNSGVYTYTVTSQGCGDDFAVYSLTFTEPFTSGVEAECNPGGTTFNASIELAGGMAPYTVNGDDVEGNVYEAYDLAVTDGEALFVIVDAGICDAIEISIGVDDTDGDGVCDGQEITGCMDPLATNYNPNATDPGNCWFEIGGFEAALSEWDVEPGFEKPISDVNFGVVNASGLKLHMHIFPNPTVGQDLNIEIAGLSGVGTRIEITDILGSVRYRSVLASADGGVLKKIALEGYGNGVYLIRLIDGDEILVRKFVVER